VGWPTPNGILKHKQAPRPALARVARRDDEQQFRFMMRIHDPLKQWKLSPMDVESRARWEQYTKAKDVMFEHTHIPEAPWWVVEAVDKKRARLNCINHLLTQFPYQEIQRDAVVLPPRVARRRWPAPMSRLIAGCNPPFLNRKPPRARPRAYRSLRPSTEQ